MLKAGEVELGQLGEFHALVGEEGGKGKKELDKLIFELKINITIGLSTPENLYRWFNMAIGRSNGNELLPNYSNLLLEVKINVTIGLSTPENLYKWFDMTIGRKKFNFVT